MKNKNILLPFLILIIFFSLNSEKVFGQITLQAGAGLGYMVPSGDYGGSAEDFYNGTKYGMGSALSYNIKAKVGLAGFFLFSGQVDYASLSSEGDVPNGQGNFKVNNNIVSIKVGPQFNINIPLSPISPYLDANIAVNFFSGDIEFNGVSGVPNAKFNIEPAARLGAGVGGGVLFSLGPLLHLDLGIHYNFMNLTGKEYKDVNPLTNDRVDSYLALNDDKDPNYSENSSVNIIGNSRSINALEINLTVLVGL